MTVDSSRTLLRRRPCKPFGLVMTSGKAYEVRHPEMAWMTKTDILVGIDVANDGLPADFDICPLFHVATIETIAGDTPAA